MNSKIKSLGLKFYIFETFYKKINEVISDDTFRGKVYIDQQIKTVIPHSLLIF
jgi:hypothetical protein